MLIGIDANEANVQNRVGSNEFAYQILWQLYRQGSKQQFLIYLSSAPVADLPQPKANWQYRTFPPKFFWTQWRLPLSLYLDKNRPNVFLTLGHYAPRFSPIPTMVCIMDLAFLKFPDSFLKSDLYKLKNWTAYSVKHACHIFAISQATKNDIMTSYNIPENKISVVYPGVEQLKVSGKSLVDGQYLLYVGTLQPRKNLDALIEAFSSITHPVCDEFSHRVWKKWPQLVIAGKVGWKFKIKPVSHVKYLGYVPNEKLGALIKSATALVLPSLYEGFGIPVVQAMSLGTPVLVSRNSSLPEIVGDAGFYIEPPFGPDEIKQGIIKVLSLTTESKRTIINKAKIRAQQFKWSKAAEKILEVINDIKIAA
ncbi:MAG: glycosyltransferase family 1 protein [Candidatus Beckwithbacteria bacterium]|nr:glycosyltransferase family 1 protein [Candidatus Beckwithbacteria bacterium]